MDELTPNLLPFLITLLKDQSTEADRSSKALATSELSRAVPRSNIVKSFEPTETPSMPTLIKSSIRITFTGNSTIIQNLKVGLSKNPSAATILLMVASSSVDRTKGTINQIFLYF